MDKNELAELLKKYNAGLATEQESAFVEAYYQLFELREEQLNHIPEVEKENLKAGIKAFLYEQIAMEGNYIPKTKPLYWKWAAAAIFLIVFAVSLLFIKGNKEDKSSLQAKFHKDTSIMPGTNQAVLTLANGTVINLNEEDQGTLLKDNGVVISKNSDGLIVYQVTDKAIASMNTISTPRGGQYQLILSDGTKVWLNADTRITFSTKFDGTERSINLVGEAYFEVAKDKHKPFKVYTQNQTIEVLGTHFNVNSYVEDAVAKTTLLEGSVKVNLLKGGAGKVLKPGQAVYFSKDDNSVEVLEVDTETAVAWKNGYFRFDHIDLRTLMSQVARWYNVDVEYKGDLSDDLFTGKLKRSDDIKEILRILELSNIKTSIEGRTIIISNKF